MWDVLAELATFETDRLILRPFHFGDKEALFDILGHESNVKFLHPVLPSLEACQNLMVEAFMRHPLGVWAIEDKQSGCMIGAIRLEQIRLQEKRAEIGYFLHRDFWQRGLMTEALSSLIFLCFSRLDMAELIIKTHAENLASQKLAETVGFTLYRQYKGSDRHSHKTRHYRDYHYLKKNYHLKEDL